MYKIFDEYPYNLYIKGIAQKIRELNDNLLLSYGLNTSQAILLWHISHSMEEQIDINRKFLQETMNLSGPSVTNLLNGLEKTSFIIRGNSAADSRNLNIKITEKAKQLIDEMGKAFQKSEELLTEGMSEAEKAMFASLLKQAFENVDRCLSK